MPLAPPEEQRPLLEPLDSSISQKTLSPLGSERPRSIRSLASYGATERAPSPSPEPEGRPGRKTKKESGNRCLCISVSILLAVCVYASFVEDFMGDVETAISCATCIGLLAPLQALAHVGDDAFVDLFVGFCTKLGIEDSDVCAGAVGTQAPILAHDLRSMSLASHAAKNFCSTVFGLCPLQKTIPHAVNLTAAPVSLEEFEAASLEGWRPRIAKEWKSRGREPFQVVHISDVHVDRSYTEGASTTCSKVICCRDYGPGSIGEKVKSPAGKFGHKKCDAPEALVESMFDAIDHFAPIKSFSIFTGDVVESAVWAVDEAGVSNDLKRWNDDLQAPSYPVIGNHDVAPVNAFPRSTSPSSQASQWVFDIAARDWKKWIGRKAAEQVRTMSGCYARLHPGTNLKIISINTNYWYKQNFWLYDSDVPIWDPNGILTWMASELDLAERLGQRAWIIGHMPFGKVDAMRDQSNYANQIFQRYHNTIAAHFYGHSHVDEFEIAYPDYDDRRAETANGIAFISGALTPTSGNPVFRIYDIDPDTYEVMDFTPIYTNKTDPTFQAGPTWKRYYSARESYNAYLEPPHPVEASLNATFWHRVTEVFERNETVFQLFNTRLSRGGKVEDCSGPICKKNTICMLRSMRSESNCAVIQPGLSFKDQKRDTDAVTEPNRDEEISSFLSTAPVAEEELFAQSRHHDFFACEGPGLGSMLRKLGSGWSGKGEIGVLENPAESQDTPFSALREFEKAAHEAVKKHRPKRSFFKP
ncbi:endopolyphosphatase [Sporobolomyces salmoneus]|uniref:endopolyphosphatase n=1 Tax=Sporobolomyces salmoneus TaxID=183962 RepID=UPI00318080B0